MSAAAAVFAPGSTALITGGASGVGLAIAKLCRSKGMKLLLVDRNAEALEKAKAEVGSSSSDVATSVLDVSKLDGWASLRDQATKTFGSIELLVLNAGTGARGTWGDSDYFRAVRADYWREDEDEAKERRTRS
jgi:short-subunit dehydrogenase